MINNILNCCKNNNAVVDTLDVNIRRPSLRNADTSTQIQPQVQIPLDEDENENVNIPIHIIREYILPRIENTDNVRALAEAHLSELRQDPDKLLRSSDINTMRDHFYKQKVVQASLEEFYILLKKPEVSDDIIAHGINNHHPTDSLEVKKALIYSRRDLSDEHIEQLIALNDTEVNLSLIRSGRDLSRERIEQFIALGNREVNLALIRSSRPLSDERIEQFIALGDDEVNHDLIIHRTLSDDRMQLLPASAVHFAETRREALLSDARCQTIKHDNQ